MHTFPDVVITGPDYSIWLWLLVPVILVGVFWVVEHLIEDYTEKKKGRPLIGVGYVLMGVALFTIPMSVPLITDYQEHVQTQKAISALESIGFDEVRLTGSSGSFGGYYGDDLMRGALVPDQYHQDVYFVIQTPKPVSD